MDLSQPPQMTLFRQRTSNMYKSHQRRARRLQQLLDYTLTDLRNLATHSELCPYCQTPLDPANISIDHTIPTSRAGTFGLANLLPCCRACNETKGNLTQTEFRNLLTTIANWEPRVQQELLRRLRRGGRLRR